MSLRKNEHGLFRKTFNATMCRRYSAVTARPDSRTNIPLYYCEDLPHKDFNDPNSLVTEHHALPNPPGLVHLTKRCNLHINTESFRNPTKKYGRSSIEFTKYGQIEGAL